MSTNSSPDIRKRKNEHISICLDPKNNIEPASTRLDEVHLVHRALPDIHLEDVSTETDFLQHRLSLPLIISPMTGGGMREQLNRDLVCLAQRERIAVSTGSIRVLFYNDELRSHFDLKDLAPDVPFIANLGAMQLAELEGERIAEMLSLLRYDAITIHLNCLQEYFQDDGCRDFRNLLKHIAYFIELSPVPVIVKETGLGLDLDSCQKLLEINVAGVDLAGSGGTNWVLVEGQRHPSTEISDAAQEFAQWGNPLALLLSVVREGLDGWKEGRDRTLIASGGIRTGMDVLKSLVLGADMAGMALPILRAQHAGGIEGAQSYVQRISHVLRAGMLGLACTRIDQLSSAVHYLSRSLEDDCHAFLQASMRAARS